MKKKDIKLLEDYLEGHLTDEEITELESRIKDDPSFAEEAKSHKFFIKKLNETGKRNRLKNLVSAIHDTLSPEDLKYNPSLGQVITIFWKQHYATMAIAASVALITVFALSLINQSLKPNGNQFAYRELKRDVEKLKKSQKAIINSIDSKVLSPNSGATAFVIAKKGYLLTSYHAVKNADSLVVENNNFSRYKVKIIFEDQKKDLALLKIVDKKFKSFEGLNLLMKSRKLNLSEKVFTLGYPKEDIVYGEGTVASSTGYDGDENAFQISVPVNPGNSGSPLFDNDGNVIGMISGKHLTDEGTSFAIKPAQLLDFIKSVPKDVAKDLKLNKTVGIASKNRPNQIKEMQKFVFIVKVY
jgi:S1-C subfamily serine protease